MNESKKTALVIGATGATGQHIVGELLAHKDYESVVVFVRRPISTEHPKLIVYVVDFDQPQEWADLVVGDELFSALGTTLKIAGSKAGQYRVDVTYQLNAATTALANGVSSLFLVSSPNARSKSLSFYLRIKGELDDAVSELGFSHTVLIKPSIIESDRADVRIGEKIGAFGIRAMSKVTPLVRKYRPIKAQQLAQAMVNIAQSELPKGVTVVELDKLFEFVCEGLNVEN